MPPSNMGYWPSIRVLLLLSGVPKGERRGTDGISGSTGVAEGFESPPGMPQGASEQTGSLPSERKDRVHMTLYERKQAALSVRPPARLPATSSRGWLVRGSPF